MISCMISYHIKDLTVPSPEAVAFQIERVASCLGPSTVELTLPLNATGWSGMSRTSCSMSAASMQEGMCFNRSASISASSSISMSVRGP